MNDRGRTPKNFFTIGTACCGFDGSRPMRQIRSRMREAIVLSFAFVVHAGATAMYDYKLEEFLLIDGGTSPDKNRPLSIMFGLTLKVNASFCLTTNVES
jgi:hypothetical protein